MRSVWLLLPLLLCSIGLVAAAAAATPFDASEQKARARVAATCPRERSFCAASLTRTTRRDEMVSSRGVALESSSSSIAPFLTFHRHPLLRDFEDFLDAMSVTPPPPCQVSPRRTHLRGSVHIIYSSRSSRSTNGVIYSSGWFVLPPPLTLPMEPLPSTTNVMVARRRLQEIVPEAVPVPEVSDEEMQCLQQYVMNHRETTSSSDCVDAVLEWQALQKKDASSGPSTVTTPVPAASAPSSSLTFFMGRPFLVLAANMLFVLALWIILLLLYVYHLAEDDDDDEEEDDEGSTTEYTKPEFHALRTVLSVPSNDDDDSKAVYIGVPLQIV